MRGRNGRLFLANDTNDVVLQHSGERRFSDEDLRRWRELLEQREDWLRSLGIPYHFFVPPNAHSVYPEDLPGGIPSAPERPIHQLLGHLRETHSSARIVYLLDALVAAKPDPRLYSKTDPHWTGHGAFVAYEKLVEEVSRDVVLHRVPRDDVNFVEVLQTGELGFKLEPEEKSIELYAQVVQPQAWLIHDNCVMNVGKMIVTECPEAPPTKCLLFGDSYADHMLPFLAASFGRLVFAQIPSLDRELVLAERPDVVISMLNERFLIYVPDDTGGKSVQDFAELKLAEGAVRPEARFWPKQRVAEDAEVVEEAT